MLSTTTGLCLALAVIVAAILVTAALRGLCRAVRLKRVLQDHDEAEALLGGLDVPFGGAECRCFWQYLEGGHLRICEPPPVSDGQADRMWRAVQDGEEL